MECPEVRFETPPILPGAICEHRHALMLEALRIDCDLHFPGWRERYTRYYDALVRGREAIVVVARAYDEIVGSAIGSLLHDYRSEVFDQRAGHINGMFVQRGWRKRGVGRGLVHTLIGALSNRGCAVIYLAPTPSAKPLYESVGFRDVSHMYLPVAHDRHAMILRLSPRGRESFLEVSR
jgi:GNAT superfamily N-acetyltransferase